MKKTAIFVDIIAAGFVILHSPQERKRTTDGRIVFRDIFHLFIGMEWRKLLLFSDHKNILKYKLRNSYLPALIRRPCFVKPPRMPNKLDFRKASNLSDRRPLTSDLQK